VQVEHVVDERAVHPRSAAAQDRETTAGDPDAALEVEHAEVLAELVVRLGRKVEHRALAPRVQHRVIGLAGAGRDVRVRRVRDREEALLAHRFELGELELALLDLGRQRLHAVAGRRELGRLLVELGHRLVGRVARLPQRVELALLLATACVEVPPRNHQRGNRGVAAAKDIVHPGWVEHA